jgi:hypothetical protein
MNSPYTMKPLWKATWLIQIKMFHKVPGSPARFYWQIVGFNQLQRTYIHCKDNVIYLRQCKDSPTPQHCIGMFKRFATLNGITHYRIINDKEKI